MPASVDTLPLAAALERVQERLHRAAQRAGRRPQDIDLLAVTKTLPAERVADALRLGLTHLGESRVQELEAKRELLAGLPAAPAGADVRWHLIGHLQSNKARRAVGLFDCLQSLDSLRLAQRLNEEGARRARPVSCLVEVKISDEPNKQGLAPDALESFLAQAGPLSFLRIEGLMGVAPQDPGDVRPAFQKLRRLFERYASWFPVSHPVLSMGMSGDFETAVEEGSTLVRVGTALFGARTP